MFAEAIFWEQVRCDGSDRGVAFALPSHCFGLALRSCCRARVADVHRWIGSFRSLYRHFVSFVPLSQEATLASKSLLHLLDTVELLTCECWLVSRHNIYPSLNQLVFLLGPFYG